MIINFWLALRHNEFQGPTLWRFEVIGYNRDMSLVIMGWFEKMKQRNTPVWMSLPIHCSTSTIALSDLIAHGLARHRYN